MRCPFCGHEDTQVKDSAPRRIIRPFAVAGSALIAARDLPRSNESNCAS